MRRHSLRLDPERGNDAERGTCHDVLMFVLLVAAQLLTLLGMAVVSVWGRKHLSPETRVRARTGLTGLDYTMSKSTTLILAPLIGSLVVIATLALSDSPSREMVALLGAALLTIYLAAHWYSVRRAAR